MVEKFFVCNNKVTEPGVQSCVWCSHYKMPYFINLTLMFFWQPKQDKTIALINVTSLFIVYRKGLFNIQEQFHNKAGICTWGQWRCIIRYGLLQEICKLNWCKARSLIKFRLKEDELKQCTKCYGMMQCSLYDKIWLMGGVWQVVVTNLRVL